MDVDFSTGNLKVKTRYVESLINEAYIKHYINTTYAKSIIDKDYIKDNIVNESCHKDHYKYIGETILEKCALCWVTLKDQSMIDKTIDINNAVLTIKTSANYKYKDKEYCERTNNPTFHLDITHFNIPRSNR